MANAIVEYRTVPDYPAYRVGNDGTVWTRFLRGGQGSLADWKMLRPGRLHAGHVKVTLCRNGKKWGVQVHQLILLCFKGPSPEGMEVRHLNGVSNDNRLANLAYGTPAQNASDKIGHGTDNRGERHAMVKLKESDVARIKGRLKAGEVERIIAADFGVSRSCIAMIALGKNWRWVDAVS